MGYSSAYRAASAAIPGVWKSRPIANPVRVRTPGPELRPTTRSIPKRSAVVFAGGTNESSPPGCFSGKCNLAYARIKYREEC